MSIMNYNSWFHKYHQYLTGDRNGVRTYNDTKWRTLNERYHYDEACSPGPAAHLW